MGVCGTTTRVQASGRTLNKATFYFCCKMSFAAPAPGGLRLVVPHPSVLGVLKLTGVDRLLPVCPSLEAALAAGRGRQL